MGRGRESAPGLGMALSDKRLLSRDPITGLLTYHQYDESTDQTIIIYDAPSAPVLERNKILQNDADYTKQGMRSTTRIGCAGAKYGATCSDRRRCRIPIAIVRDLAVAVTCITLASGMRNRIPPKISPKRLPCG